MASLAELLVSSTSNAINDSNGGLGNLGQSVQAGMQLAQRKEQLVHEQDKLKLDKKMAMGQGLNLFSTASEKALRFEGKLLNQVIANHLKPLAENYGIEVSDTFWEALKNKETLNRDKLGSTLTNLRESIKAEDGEALNQPMSELAGFFGGDMDKTFDFTKDLIKSQNNIIAQQATLSATEQNRQRQQSNFASSQNEGRRKEGVQSRKALSKEIIALGLPGLNTTLDALDKVVPGGIAKWSGKNIPGIGGAEAALPTARLSKEGKRVRQLALGLGNQILKLRTGAAVTTSEATRILGELGLDQALGEGGGVTLLFKGTKSDQDFINGVKDAQDNLKRVEGTLKGGFGEEAFNAVIKGLREPEQKRESTTEPGVRMIEQEEADQIVGIIKSKPDMKGEDIVARLQQSFPGATAEQINALIKKARN